MSEPARRTVIAAVFILAAVIATYLPSLGNGYIWDDDYYVTENATLRSADGLKRIWTEPRATPQYYPLVHTTYWLEYRLWGAKPAGYHAVNGVLHGVAAVLAWAVLRALSLPGAFAAALLFGLHPVNVESVAWITERKNVLSGVCYLAAALAFLRFAGVRPGGGDEDAGARESRRWAWCAAALGFFAAALLSKTVTATLPIALALVIWWRRGSLRRAEALALVPMLAVGAGMGSLTAWLEATQVGARGVDFDLSWCQRLLVAGRACWFYLGKLAWPSDLTFIYPRWTVDCRVWWQYLFPAGAAALVAVLWALRGRIGRGPLVAALYFGVTLAPALGFINVFPMQYSFVADHFQYLASLGPLSLGGFLLERASRSAMAGRARAAAVLQAAPLLVLAVLSVLRQPAYRDTETIWRDTLARNPSSWMVHCNLGDTLAEQGRSAEALQHYLTAVALKPNVPTMHYSLGFIYLNLGDRENALREYRITRSLNAALGERMRSFFAALIGPFPD